MDWSYVAGFFDGEGNLEVSSRKRHTHARVVFTNSSREVLEAIRDFLGCGTILMKRARNPRWKACYVLRVNNHRDSLRVAREILKHSIVKRKELEEFISFVEGRSWRRPRAKMTVPVEELIRLYQEEKLSTDEIASKVGVSQSAVYRKLKEAGVKLRSGGEAQRLRAMRSGQVCRRRVWTSEEVAFLKENYRKMSLGDIAKALGRGRQAVWWKLSQIRRVQAPSAIKVNVFRRRM